MKRLDRTAGILALALSALVCAPGVVLGQAEGMTATTEIDSVEVRRFAIAHIAVNDARDEFHGKVARVHDPEGRLRAREEVEAAIDEILETHELTREDFDRLTLMISLDGELRTLFEAILVELEEETGDQAP